MRKSRLIAAALASVLIVSSPSISWSGIAVPVPVPSTGSTVPVGVWALVGCTASIMLAAIVAGQRDNRELTTGEAATCGLLFWLAGSR